MRSDIGTHHERRTYVAVPLTRDAKVAHPDGVRGHYASAKNMIKFGIRNAHPGQYSIRDMALPGVELAVAYVRA